MTLFEWYPEIRHAHMGLVGASGTLFLLRGVGVLTDARWPMRGAVRAASVAIDTLLLGAGVTLWWLLQLNPLLRDHWLGAKLALLIVYIMLGSVAMKRARGPVARAASMLAAVVVFATMISVALTRHPLGAWSWF